MGKNGSRWRHEWVPLNAQAALLKTRGRSSHFDASAAVARTRPRSTARPAARTPRPPLKDEHGRDLRSVSWLGGLQSGNRPGMTVAQEYREKEIRGNYSPQDFAVAKAAGFSHPRDYQSHLTEHIRKNGLINAPQVYTEDKMLGEGYHRYAALRKLGIKRTRVGMI